jgi:anti-sigma B factor antagonist
MNLVTIQHVQGNLPITVLQLHGRVNLGNAAELEQAAREAFASGSRDMVIDLTKAPSLTSAGIRVILTIHKMLSTGGRGGTTPLKLVCPTPYVRDTLKVAGLMDYIQVFTTLEEAVATF